MFQLFELRHDKTNKMSVRPAKMQISLDIRSVWSESSLCIQWVAKDPGFLQADSEDSDQTGRMPRLIWVFAGRTLTLLVLSCRGSFVSGLWWVSRFLWAGLSDRLWSPATVATGSQHYAAAGTTKTASQTTGYRACWAVPVRSHRLWWTLADGSQIAHVV